MLVSSTLLAACDTRAPPAEPVAKAPASAPTPALPTPATPAAAGPTDAATARDTKANDPAGPLSKQEESTAMPMAGQANNHSSPAVEKGKP